MGDTGKPDLKVVKPTGPRNRFRPKPGAQFDLFDRRPITLPGIQLQARGAVIGQTVKIGQWGAAFEVAYSSSESAPFWIGDLWNYASDREDWKDELPQILAEMGLDLEIDTIEKYGRVARQVSGATRQHAATFTHAMAVADLEAGDQVALLDEAREEKLSTRDLRKLKKRRFRPATVEGSAALEGMYRVIYADCPWSYGDSMPSTSNVTDHYPPMSIEDLCGLPVASHALPDSVLFFWVTAPLLLQNPGPREVIEAWGFKPKTGMVWDKVRHGFGNYVSIRHEHLIIATRGSCTPDAREPMIDSVQTVRREDVHSAKPDEFRHAIERLYTTGPYLELFGRKRVKGWTVFGNDARLWADQARKAASA